MVTVFPSGLFSTVVLGSDFTTFCFGASAFFSSAFFSTPFSSSLSGAKGAASPAFSVSAKIPVVYS